MLDKARVQRIYGMGAALGMLDRENHSDDMLHNLVFGLTGKNSVKSLDYDEYKAVVGELAERIKISQMEVPPVRAKAYRAKKHQDTARGMTEGQQRKIWHLMYKLSEFDAAPSSATKGERLCGIIKRELSIDASANKPFVWLGFADGNKLIEVLKNYVKSAQHKAAKGG